MRLILIAIALTIVGCSVHDLEYSAATVAGSSAQGWEQHDPWNKIPEDQTPPLEVSIQAPPANSKVSDAGLVLSGRCNFNTTSIQIYLKDEKLASAVCESGRWFSTKIPYEKLPKGYFQLFAKAQDDSGRSSMQGRSFEK